MGILLSILHPVLSNFEEIQMKRLMSILAVVFTLAISTWAVEAEAAKRMGSGKSMGTQRQAAPDKAPAAATPSGWHTTLVLTDLDGTVLAANPTVLAALGYALEEIKGQPHTLLVDASTRESAGYKQLWQDLAAGQSHTGEAKHLRKDGTAVWIQASYQPVLNAANRAVGRAEKLHAHEAGLLHRAFSIFLVDERGRVLLQQRQRIGDRLACADSLGDFLSE